MWYHYLSLISLIWFCLLNIFLWIFSSFLYCVFLMYLCWTCICGNVLLALGLVDLFYISHNVFVILLLSISLAVVLPFLSWLFLMYLCWTWICGNALFAHHQLIPMDLCLFDLLLYKLNPPWYHIRVWIDQCIIQTPPTIAHQTPQPSHIRLYPFGLIQPVCQLSIGHTSTKARIYLNKVFTPITLTNNCETITLLTPWLNATRVIL